MTLILVVGGDWQTGAGKTHTLLGQSDDKLELNETQGLIPLTAAYFFEKQVEYRQLTPD